MRVKDEVVTVSRVSETYMRAILFDLSEKVMNTYDWNSRRSNERKQKHTFELC